ncbi:substrate-binding domain-containing protein [Natronorarus salvus]|uniref:substrate-binding domain-containing protein n=1 Tax=Natronorarus salvus TaxID=3117733 RepID=UPI002F26A487
MRRRTFMRYGGGVGATLALAGCLDDEDEDDPQPDDDGTDADEPDTETDDTDDAGLDFPTESLEWMVPWSEGGGTDQYVRTIQPIVEEELGESIAVDNREGASQQIGTQHLYTQEPDGHRFGTVTVPGWQFAWLIDEIDDWHVAEFEPIATHGEFGYTIIVNDAYGIEDFEELRDAYDDGEIGTFAFQGVGSASHVVTQLLRDEYGMNWESSVPYDGGALVNEAVISDEVPAGISTNTSAVDAVDSGEASMAVNLTTLELEAFPEVESIAEYGDEMDYITRFVQTAIAPPETPENVRQVVSEAIETAVEHKDTQAWSEETGNIVSYGDMDEANEQIEGTLSQLEENVDIEEFRQMVEEEG